MIRLRFAKRFSCGAHAAYARCAYRAFCLQFDALLIKPIWAQTSIALQTNCSLKDPTTFLISNCSDRKALNAFQIKFILY